jgi:hypothetical protein
MHGFSSSRSFVEVDIFGVSAERWQSPGQEPTRCWMPAAASTSWALSIGSVERLDENSVRRARGSRGLDAMIRQPDIFRPKLESPTDADVQTEIVHVLGQRA